MVLILVYPPAVDDSYKKFCFCYWLQHKIQVIYNNWGQQYRNGDITEAEWHQFLEEWYEPRDDLIVGEILRLRQLAKDQDWGFNLSEIFIEE